MAESFIKWVGGKQNVVKQLRQLYPHKELMEGKIDTYIEPFLGGGSVFFDICSIYPSLKRVILNDINISLIIVYRCLQSDYKNLLSYLWRVQQEIDKLDETELEKYYYKVRDAYNRDLLLLREGREINRVLHTVYFIFLNKISFGGLYRLNSDGMYNAPFGKGRRRDKIFNFENIESVGKFLQGVKFHCGDYRELSPYINSKSFVYLDPPYRPIKGEDNFIGYFDKSFSENKSHIEFAEWFHSMSNKGAYLMMSNSDSKDGFFEEYYKGCNFTKIGVNRTINSDPKNKGKVDEIVIRNYL